MRGFDGLVHLRTTTEFLECRQPDEGLFLVTDRRGDESDHGIELPLHAYGLIERGVGVPAQALHIPADRLGRQGIILTKVIDRLHGSLGVGDELLEPVRELLGDPLEHR